jgi:hypothetical protein
LDPLPSPDPPPADPRFLLIIIIFFGLQIML